MSAEVVSITRIPQHRWRNKVPNEYKGNLDERLQWMWHQKFGTVQTVYLESDDLLDKTAATLVLQAIMGRDLRSIQQLFQRLEGGSVTDQSILTIEEELPI